MAEAPDFNQITNRICEAIESPGRSIVEIGDFIEEQLRLAWNARGAADIVKLDAELSSMMGVTASGPYVKNLDRALRSLDR